MMTTMGSTVVFKVKFSFNFAKFDSSLIIGNGESRRGMALNHLMDYKLFKIGCNVAYEEFSNLDYVVIMDEEVVKYAQKFNRQTSKLIIANADEKLEPPEYCAQENIKISRANNSGMLAMQKAIDELGVVKLYCLGFDFLIDDPALNVGNIFENHPAYAIKPTVDDCINRCRYLTWFARKYNHVTFYFVYPDDFNKKRFRQIASPNVKGMFYSAFEEEAVQWS